MQKVKVGQIWRNTTRSQIIEIIPRKNEKDSDLICYKIVEQDAENNLRVHFKNAEHIKRLYVLY